jgi:cytoskeletal protein RodZ
MPTVGDHLRVGRERLNLSVHEVANATNIKTDHIRAMEACEWDVFSARVYIKGFVRTYATHLKLDQEVVMRELEEELGRNPEFSDAPSLTGRRKGPLDWLMLQLSRVKWAWVFPVVVGVGVLVAAIYGFKAWQRQTKTDPLRQLSPGLHNQRRPVTAPQTLPLPTNLPPAAPRR